jgi:hypothetical protein
MLPIVTDTVSVDRVAIYNASVLPSNPLTGVRMRNITGKHLLQGPITVHDGDRYVGDARIDDIPPGQERLLSYGIDLDVLVDNSKQKDTSVFVTARMVKGVLVVRRRSATSQEYAIDNKGDAEKRVVIEHPVRTGWKLADTPKPVETTPAVYRFEKLAPAKRVTTFTVREEGLWSETLRIGPADTATLLSYSRIGEMPAEVREALTRAIAFKQRLADTERQIADRTKQVTEITQEQARIRDNMKTVNGGTPYYKRLLQKLNEQESAIERLQHERDDLNRRRDAERKELEDYVAGLTIG